MKQIVIFGTGVAGKRAYRYAEEQDDFVVIAFADNDVTKQGSDFYGLPILSAEQVASRNDWHFIWVASLWHQDISDGLKRLGVPEQHIIPFGSKPNAKQLWRMQSVGSLDVPISIGPNTRKASDLPRVLILSCETLNESHGTGVLLKRYFGAFPARHLYSIHLLDAGSHAWLEQSFRVSTVGAIGRDMIRRTLEDADFVPDLIFATALWENDLVLLQMAQDVFGKHIPIVQFFMDLLPQREDAFYDLLNELSPSINAIWALSKPLQKRLHIKLDRPVEHVSGLPIRMPEKPIQPSARSFALGFRTVMIGNFYNLQIVPFMREVWSRCQQRLPGLGPVEWYVDPRRAQALFEEDADPGTDFVWRGFFMGNGLRERLSRADLALLPFNHGYEATTHYQRYSLPSRFSEYASAGLPIFAFATPDTPLSGFMLETGCGRVHPGHDIETAVAALSGFILDTEARKEASLVSLELASQHFDLERFRAWFHGRLCDLVEQSSGGVSDRD